MEGSERLYDDSEQQNFDWIAEGNPRVGRFEDDSPPPANGESDDDDSGPIHPGTLYAREYFSPAKLKSLLAAIRERELDPVKLTAWKLLAMSQIPEARFD